jgi:predicted nucleotidyltransferase
MIEALRAALEAEPLVAYALLFGSRARGAAHTLSDVDLAIGTRPGSGLTLEALGLLTAALESAARTRVDLVLLDEAPPGLAYRAFRDGKTIFVRDRGVLVARRVRAILEYLDFQPIETLCAEGVLKARHGR